MGMYLSPLVLGRASDSSKIILVNGIDRGRSVSSSTLRYVRLAIVGNVGIREMSWWGKALASNLVT